MDKFQAAPPNGDILIVDDTLPNLRILSGILTEHGYEVRGVPDGATALLVATSKPPDLILLDINMPKMNGYEVCRCLKQEPQTRDIPVIFISALSELADKIKGFSVGGVDYITKPFQVEEVLARVQTHLTLRYQQQQLEQEISQRKQAEEALQKVNDELEQRVESRTAEIRRRNRELTLLNQVIAASATPPNAGPESILKLTCRELALAFEISHTVAFLLNEEKRAVIAVAEYQTEDRLSILNRAFSIKSNPVAQYLLTHRSPLVAGKILSDPRLVSARDALQQYGTVSLLVIPLIIEEEVVGALVLSAAKPRPFSPADVSLAQSVARQVTGAMARIRLDEERQQLETQYHQAQKMEAVGLLAGGIAHDFNNLLTVIIGYAEAVLTRLPPYDPLQEKVDRIRQAGQRAARLTRQLLIFSRKDIVEPQVLDLSSVVIEMEKMLRRIIGEDVRMETHLSTDLGLVKIDPSQMEQVIVNLAVNARDAMPNGGKLVIELTNALLDKDFVENHFEAEAGEYVLLTVSDTGCGMSNKVKARIFEPFFTTKAMGKGTGLGLATVFGIVKQAGGTIWVYSEEEIGTTFKIYLPLAKETTVSRSRQETEEVLPSGSETILLVEDNANVRELIRYTLEGLGYALLEAENASEALQGFEAYPDHIHLLITDVIMPGMSGKELAGQLVERQPNLIVLFISGYTGQVIAQQGVLEPGVEFLQKPFSPATLAQKVRDVLDG